ncbi:hypothetical protein I7G59_06375 [Sinorhizobium meliloti]|uniref:hypothetical protein n=1 Tax=Rhizobium meliloti TaxID=382 RepID=UPI00237FF3C0|nr:hypothetical protein [Sinorhizobium meliloti]MDE3796959.1 hypothetical protein [Sinorhizobium meliloti]
MAFYLYDPGDGADTCYTAYASLADAMAGADSLISIYRDQCDPEWPEYVEGIAVYEADSADAPDEGRLVARTVEHNRIERPDDVDEDGYSPSEDLWFDSVDYYVDYKMEAA